MCGALGVRTVAGVSCAGTGVCGARLSVCAEQDGVHARPQPGRADEGKRARTAAGEGEFELAATFALDEETGPRGEEVFFGREQPGQRSSRDLPVVPPEQFAGGAVGVEDEFVAGDDEALVEQLEQGEIDPGFRALGEIGNERFGGLAAARFGRQAWGASCCIHG